MNRNQKFIAGNWKMNGLAASLSQIAEINRELAGLGDTAPEALICPPATLLSKAMEIVDGGPLQIGAQNCHAAISGAHTGDISAEMVAELGVRTILAGHSERRTDHRESDAMVKQKTQAVWRAGCAAIICIGETEAERKAGKAFDIVDRQIAASVPDGGSSTNILIAYEPVWAIGTGMVPEMTDIEEMHNYVRARLIKRFGHAAERIRLLYGGSVKASNAKEILALGSVDGALVGGASLAASDFLGIIQQTL